MMKNLNILVLLLLSINCKAQTVTLTTPRYQILQGAYFKDTLNDMDKFVGTWQYSNGVDLLTIIIQKKTNVYNGKHYEDLLIGEYSYVNNGIEVVNTLPLLNDNTIIGREHNISGRHLILNNIYITCNDCGTNEKRFMLNFHDPERNYLSLSLVLRYLTPNIGEPIKMTATLISNGGGIIPEENSPTNPRIPYGEYLMIKQ